MRAAPHILLADDELTLRESLQDALEEAGHRTAAARNGEEALGLLDRLSRPALVFLDLQMPIMDGIAFLGELRRRPDHGDFEVIAMSALVDGEWLERVPEVRRTLRKPFDVGTLIAEADDFVARHGTTDASAAPASQERTPVLGPAAKTAGPEKS